jgi:hypothetical protein
MEHANMYESELDEFTVPSQVEDPVEASNRRKIQNQALGKDPWKWRPLSEPEFADSIKAPELISDLRPGEEAGGAEESEPAEPPREQTGYASPSIGSLLQIRNEAIQRFEEEGMCLRPAVNVAPLGDIDIPPRYVRPRRAYRSSLRFRRIRPQKEKAAKGFPSGTPKGFTSLLPIFEAQPTFESLTGDHAMAGTLTTRPGTPMENRLQAGPPNMHLAAVRRAPLRGRLRSQGTTGEAQGARPEAAPLDFSPRPEWANTTRLSFEVSGFRFGGEPPRRQRTIARTSGYSDRVVDVAALLAEDIEYAPVPEPVFFGDIQWDEIEAEGTETAGEPASLTAGRGVVDLELYEPDPPPLATVPEPLVREPAEEEAEEPVDPNRLLAPLDEEDEEQAPADGSPVEIEDEAVVAAAAPATTIEEAAVAAEEQPDAELAQQDDLLEAVRMAEELGEGRPRLLAVEAPQFPIPDEPLAPGGARLHLPVLAHLPLRAVMVEGPRPGKSGETESRQAAGSRSQQQQQESSGSNGQEKGQRSRRQRRAAENGSEKSSTAAPKRPPVVEDPVEEPFGLGEEVEAGLAAALAAVETSEPAAGEQANPVVESEFELRNVSHTSPRFTFDESPSDQAGPDFTIAAATEASTGMGTGAKIGMAAGVLVVAGAIGFFTLTGGDSAAAVAKAPTSAQANKAPAVATAGLVLGEVGWSTDNVVDGKGKRVRQLSVYRPTAQTTDYRVELQAAIDFRAVGWAVRAANTKNHMVLRIVHEKGNKARLVRFAVVDGQAGPAVEKELPFPVSFGMLYRVRMDAVGSHFSVTINDKKIEEWNETRLATGGFGVVNEGTERGQVRNVQAWHLREVAARR